MDRRARSRQPAPGIATLTDDDVLSLAAANAEIRRLRARIAELEAARAVTFGTLEQPADDPPASYVHDVPPSAPR